MPASWVMCPHRCLRLVRRKTFTTIAKSLSVDQLSQCPLNPRRGSTQGFVALPFGGKKLYHRQLWQVVEVGITRE